MEIRIASNQDVLEFTFKRLGLPLDTDPLSVESLASIILNAASMLCPRSPQGILLAVVDVLQPLLEVDNLREQCRDVLDELVAHGDLIEMDDVSGGLSNRLLYLAPPAFVRIAATKSLVLGMQPDGVRSLPADIAITRKGIARIVSYIDESRVVQKLQYAGFHELSYEAWVKPPTERTFQEFIEQFDELLARQPSSGEIGGLKIFNTKIQSPWYRERWTSPGSSNGRYVATRPRQYGADLWCYVELSNGNPLRLIDLPQGRTSERGCDQAWRLQCALDASYGKPQTYSLQPVEANRTRLIIHMPCPAWLLRHWDCLGERVNKNIFEFNFEPKDAEEEAGRLEKYLWMQPEINKGLDNVTDD